MKKCLFLLLLCFVTFAGVFAQASVKGGITLATMNEESENISRNDIERHSITGPVLGLAFDMQLSSLFTIQPELLYSQSGGRNSYSFLGSTIESTYRINYLEVPILAKIELGNSDSHKGGLGVYAAAGPWVGFALNGKSKVTSPLGTVEQDFTFDDEDNAKRLNYGFAAGAGINAGKLTLDLRYNFGVNNLLDNDADNSNDNKPVRQTRGLALTLGYNF